MSLTRLKTRSFPASADTSMPVIRILGKVAKQALLSTPACGCQPLTVAVRNISFSPRQVTSDASFHSVSFSETDHPKVLITGRQPSTAGVHNFIFFPGTKRLMTCFVLFFYFCNVFRLLVSGGCGKKKKCRQHHLTFFPYSLHYSYRSFHGNSTDDDDDRKQLLTFNAFRLLP